MFSLLIRERKREREREQRGGGGGGGERERERESWVDLAAVNARAFGIKADPSTIFAVS